MLADQPARGQRQEQRPQPDRAGCRLTGTSQAPPFAYVLARIVPAASGQVSLELPIDGSPRETMPMLFCLTADYTPQALNAMRENPNTDRRAAVEELITTAGGKLIAMYGRATNGPGAMIIFDVPDPAMAPAMCGVAVSSGSIQNVELTRLLSMEEIAGIRQKARQIYIAYKPPGQR